MRRWWLVPTVALAAATLFWLAPRPPPEVVPARMDATGEMGMEVACGGFSIIVRGRLLEARSGQPLEGAAILSVPDEHFAKDERSIAVWKERSPEELAAEAAPRGSPAQRRARAMMLASDHTTKHGAFSLFVDIPWSWTTVDGVLQGAPEPAPRTGVWALLIEREAGAPAIVLPVSGGTWERHAESDDAHGVWATWDLGDVRVPAAK